MSDFAVMMEKATLLDAAFRLGWLPPDWDGVTPPDPPSTNGVRSHEKRDPPKSERSKS